MYGGEPSALWLAAIAELTDEQVMAGLKRLATGAPREYPCNLPEFVNACKPRSDGVRYLGVPETQQERQLRLSRQKADPETAGHHLQSIRRKLRASRRGPDDL